MRRERSGHSSALSTVILSESHVNAGADSDCVAAPSENRDPPISSGPRVCAGRTLSGAEGVVRSVSADKRLADVAETAPTLNQKTPCGHANRRHRKKRHFNVVSEQPCCNNDPFGSLVSGIHPRNDILMSFPRGKPGSIPLAGRRKGTTPIPVGSGGSRLLESPPQSSAGGIHRCVGTSSTLSESRTIGSGTTGTCPGSR